MDQFKAVASSGGACAQAIGCICSCGCLAMFITLIASPILGGLFMWISTKSGMLGTCLNTLLSCGITCSGLVAWIMGMVWRFSAAGQFASGDALAEDATPGLLVQSESGNFMGIYYLITWILIGTSCGCALIGGVVSCLCK